MSRGGSGPDPPKEQDSSEDEVVRRVQEGDPAARSLLARRHYKAIHRFFLRRTGGDTQQADDLT